MKKEFDVITYEHGRRQWFCAGLLDDDNVFIMTMSDGEGRNIMLSPEDARLVAAKLMKLVGL